MQQIPLSMIHMLVVSTIGIYFIRKWHIIFPIRIASQHADGDYMI